MANAVRKNNREDIAGRANVEDTPELLAYYNELELLDTSSRSDRWIARRAVRRLHKPGRKRRIAAMNDQPVGRTDVMENGHAVLSGTGQELHDRHINPKTRFPCQAFSPGVAQVA
jgi:hypothetical protein